MIESLLSIAQLSQTQISDLLFSVRELKDADHQSSFLAGKTIALLFFENSTRTRISFEKAIRNLGGTPLSLAIATSSIQKGESLLDSARNLAALGAHAFIIRHPESGAAEFLAKNQTLPVINAGDGMHAHPTQALLDAFTLWEHWKYRKNFFSDKKILILGDVRHSRVARSNLELLPRLGAKVLISGPGSLLPSNQELKNPFGEIQKVSFPDKVLLECDAVMVLRLQLERQNAGFIPSLAEYTKFWGLTNERLKLLRPDACILHPGPANLDIEICPQAIEDPRSKILRQVEIGVITRMAVLHSLFQRREK